MPFQWAPVQPGKPSIRRKGLADIGDGQWPESLLFEPAQCHSPPLFKLMPTHLYAGAQMPRESRQCLDGRILEPVSARTRDRAEGERGPGPRGVDTTLS